MSPEIIINGTSLDQVRMRLHAPLKGMASYLGYPNSMFKIHRCENGLHLLIPPYLALELYRSGIFPQDKNNPIEITIDGTPDGRYTITDACYPQGGREEKVDFTLTRYPVIKTQKDKEKPARSPSNRKKVKSTLAIDINHYIDENGEIEISAPEPARKLASFCVLIIEAATSPFAPPIQNSGIRCRTKGCTEKIAVILHQNKEEIGWVCPACTDNGIIRNWQNTKWNQRNNP